MTMVCGGLQAVDAGGDGDAALAELHAERVFLAGVDVEALNSGGISMPMNSSPPGVDTAR
jgi:hypothetical protein